MAYGAQVQQAESNVKAEALEDILDKVGKGILWPAAATLGFGIAAGLTHKLAWGNELVDMMMNDHGTVKQVVYDIFHPMQWLKDINPEWVKEAGKAAGYGLIPAGVGTWGWAAFSDKDTHHTGREKRPDQTLGPILFDKLADGGYRQWGALLAGTGMLLAGQDAGIANFFYNTVPDFFTWQWFGNFDAEQVAKDMSFGLPKLEQFIYDKVNFLDGGFDVFHPIDWFSRGLGNVYSTFGTRIAIPTAAFVGDYIVRLGQQRTQPLQAAKNLIRNVAPVVGAGIISTGFGIGLIPTIYGLFSGDTTVSHSQMLSGSALLYGGSLMMQGSAGSAARTFSMISGMYAASNLFGYGEHALYLATAGQVAAESLYGFGRNFIDKFGAVGNMKSQEIMQRGPDFTDVAQKYLSKS